MPNLSDLSGIWDAPVASIAPSRSEPRNQSVDYTTTSDGSPKSMSSFFASVQPTPIGWHLNNNNNSRTTPTPSDKYKPYGTPLGPVTTNSALAMTSDGDDRADDSPQYFARRYQQLKEIEGYKNSLIKEPLYRYGQVSEQHKAAIVARDQEVDYNKKTRIRERQYQENIERLQLLMDRDPFVLVLIDGENAMFREDLVMKGEAGGQEAGVSLRIATQDYIARLLPDIPEDYRIVTRVFADLRKFSRYCQCAGLVNTAQTLQDFVRGFTKSHALFDFVDVSASDNVDGVAAKMTETFKLHVHDYHCRQIMMSCSNDSKYSQLLTEYALDQHTHSRVTLLEVTAFEDTIGDLPYEKTRFDTLLETRLEKYVAQAEDLTLRRQLSDLNMNEIKDFTPAKSIKAAPPAQVASASPMPSPARIWASIAAKPKPAATPVTPPATTRPATPATSKVSDGIARNRKGQRLDPVFKHDKAEVDRVKKLKMCNFQYLRGSCPNNNCQHVHTHKPSNAELTTLRLVARMAPCMNGSDCEDAKCIYGHVCPAPQHRDGRSTKDGKDCIFLEDCRFPGTLHLRGEDRKEVKFIKVT